MTDLLLDTSAVIGLLERQSPSVRSAVERATGGISVSVITIGELEHAVAAAPTTASEAHRRRSLEAIRSNATILGVTDDEAVLFGSLSHELRTKGFGPKMVGSADRWISSTAIHHGLTLVTQDRQLADALGATSSAVVLLCE